MGAMFGGGAPATPPPDPLLEQAQMESIQSRMGIAKQQQQLSD
jgi:hypothetical protein